MEFTIGGLCFRVQVVDCHVIVHLVEDDSLGEFRSERQVTDRAN